MRGVVQGLARASGEVLPRLAGGLLSVPVTAGFVLLGVAVVLGRGVRHVMTRAAAPRAAAMPAAPQRRAA